MMRNKVNTTLDIIILFLIMFLISYTIFSLPNLPDSIPNHLDSNGNVKDYMTKYFILFPAIIGSVLGIAIQILVKYPHKFNYAVEITPKNKVIQYRMAEIIMRVMNICTILIFITMNYCIINSLGSSLIYIPLLIMIIAFIIYIIKSKKNK